MTEWLNVLHLSPWQMLLAAFSGLVIGASKTGLAGIGFLAFPILADIFGARASTGVALPMLLLADFVAVGYYNRHASWRHLVKLMPWVLLGIAAALILGKNASERLFSALFAGTLLAGIALLVWRDLRKPAIEVPDSAWFCGSMGFSAGFATMIGNAAGPVMSLYLLSMRLPKTVFIGTGAWFYLTVNLVKVPLHVFVWHTISLRTLTFDIAVSPFILLGVVLGIYIVKRLGERVYRVLVMTSVSLAAVLLIAKLLVAVTSG
jgi:uncharacterized protein